MKAQPRRVTESWFRLGWAGVSAALGVVWHLVATYLSYGGLNDAIAPSLLAAGIGAGVLAGWYTMWSRKRCAGKEHLLHLLVTYYLGIGAYWFLLVALRFDWHDDYVKLLWAYLFYGTLTPFVLFLLPMAWISRVLVWRLCRT